MFMNHVSASVPERVVAVPRIAGRMRQRLLRARDYAGYERDVALLLMKSALAGVASWTVAQYFVTSPQPVYAPLVALLVVQSTVYRSLLHSVQYVAAVIAGVLAAGAASPLIGENVGAFAVMLVTALLVGRWRRLGTMGLQVPIVGIFAYNALLGAPATGMLWSIVSMVLLGAGVGLLVNLLLLPPMRYSTADRGVQELSTAVFVLLRDMAAGLREPIPEQDSAEDWLRRAR
ncbi:MAG: FUSC family protein, partial [Streptomyces sp.]